MSFANAVNAGINVGTAAFGPLAQSLDPLRRLQADALRARTQATRADTSLTPLRAQSIEAAIKQREQLIDQIKQGNELMAEFFGKAAKQQYQMATDPLAQSAVQFKAQGLGSLVGPPAALAGPSPFGAVQRSQAAPPTALERVSQIREESAEEATLSRHADARRKRMEEALLFLEQHPDYGPDVLMRLSEPQLEELIGTLIVTGELERLKAEQVQERLRTWNIGASL